MGALLPATALRFASSRLFGVPSRAHITPARPVSVRQPRAFPEAPTRPTLPAISDDLVEYYAFVFCQGGFRQLDMTFEQFLLVAAAINPADPQASRERRGR
jgi:hypothetical protein